jgi:hypothetical protein
MKYTRQNQGAEFKGEHFPIETAVIVPSTDKNQKIQDYKTQTKRVLQVRSFLAKRFGGYTSIRATGGFVSKKKGLVKEPAYKVVSFSKVKDYNKHKPALVKQVKKWGKQWGQESMGVEWEGDLFYLTSKEKKHKHTPTRRVHRRTTSIRHKAPKSVWGAWFG